MNGVRIDILPAPVIERLQTAATEGVAVATLPASAKPETRETRPQTIEPIPTVENYNVQANFEYDRELRQVFITLKREDTGEIVQQIPSEKLRRTLVGLMECVGRDLDAHG